MKRVAVTGAGGYIGQHLVNHLALDGWSVTAVVRRPPEFEFSSQVGIAIADVEEYDTLPGAITSADAVVHLACLPLQPSAANPRQAFSTNALGTFNVVQACRQAQVRRLLVVSTAYVYGDPIEVPMNERHPTLPTTPYGASKLAGDVLTLVHEHSLSLQVLVVRLFNVFGLSADGHPRPTVETHFVRRALDGLPVMIHGHPDDTRDFVHVGDVTSALATALGTGTTGIYNIGSGRACSLRNLALAAGVEAESLNFTWTGTRAPLRGQADIARARAELGFRPTVDIVDFLASLKTKLESSHAP